MNRLHRLFWQFYLLSVPYLGFSDLSFKDFLVQSGIPIIEGRVDCRAQTYIKRVKLDIGLSYNAPHSQKWLTEEPDLLVFGFEPYQRSVEEIRKGAKKRAPGHGDPLDPKFFESGRFKLIPCALGSKQGNRTFFVTEQDHGCSSLFVPKTFKVERSTEVPVYTLKDFFDLFPFDRFPYIDYIKIDAQGSDLDILKGAGDYLKQRVVYVTVEPENDQYHGTNNSLQNIREFMQESGFVEVRDQQTSDPTFLNKKFSEYPRLYSIKCYQRG